MNVNKYLYESISPICNAKFFVLILVAIKLMFKRWLNPHPKDLHSFTSGIFASLLIPSISSSIET